MARVAIPLALAAVVLVAAATAPAHRSVPRADCTKTSTSFVPLTDLRAGTFAGYRGGLYPAGRVAPSTAYLKKGLAAAKLVKPIDGKIVLLSIGMSNTTQEWQAFMQLARTYAQRNPAVTIVDGAQGGQDAEIVKDPGSRFWANVEQRLAQSGAGDAQVQAVWLKEAIARPTEQFPADAQRLRADLEAIVQILAQTFPNLRLVYVSSRTWTNGTAGRADGLVWSCGDTVADGTHPSDTGRRKVAQMLLTFFTADPTAKSWFVAR